MEIKGIINIKKISHSRGKNLRYQKILYRNEVVCAVLYFEKIYSEVITTKSVPSTTLTVALSDTNSLLTPRGKSEGRSKSERGYSVPVILTP